jgi:hypothetical protein
MKRSVTNPFDVVAAALRIVLATAFALILVAALIVVVGLGAFDIFVIQPRLAHVDTVLGSIDPDNGSPTPRLAALSFDQDVFQSNAIAAQLILATMDDHKHRETLEALVHEALWGLLLPLHYSKEDRMKAYFGLFYGGVGMSSIARHCYGRPLAQLTDEEAASMALLLRSPGRARDCLPPSGKFASD